MTPFWSEKRGQKGGNYQKMLFSPLSGSTRRKFLVFASILLLSVSFPLCAQNRLEGLFLSVSGQYYIMPDLAGAISPELADQYGVSGGIAPYPGFRAGAGYEWKNWGFALESGYTYIKGDNPLVTDISVVPLLLKVGYAFFPFSSYEYFSLTPAAALGLVFAQVDHYLGVIDMLLEESIHSKNTGFMAQLGVRAGWNPVRKWGRALEVFAGFSVDGIIETGGLIPLPQIELGVLVRPFQFKPRKAAVTPEDLVFSHTPENIVIEEGKDGRTVRLLNAVYFEADSAVMLERFRPILDEAGRRLQANPASRITLRGYTAPFGTVEGRSALSAERARYCMDYLRREFGIARARITVENYGAEKTPAFVDANWESYRCVELIIE